MKKIDYLIQESKKIAVNSIKNFCINLNLDPDLFNHIYNIDMIVRNINKNALAQYDTQENIIIINKLEINRSIMELEKNISDENTIKLELALTIVHEMLHANRTIFINGGINNNTIINTIDNDKDNIEPFDDYVSLVSNFHMKLIPQNPSNQIYEDISEMLLTQFSFEEVITELIALIIILSKNDNNLDLDKITDKLLSKNLRPAYKIITNVIKDMGSELLVWFMTSVYDDYYNYNMQEKIMNRKIK